MVLHENPCPATDNFESTGAADRSPDSCAADPARAHNLNVTSTALLSALCNHHSILLIYISTDYVFAGTPGEAPYAASATTQPTNIYGEMKYAGENSVQPGNDDIRDCGFVLRVPVLYGRCSPRTNYAESAVNCLVDAVYKAQEPINSKSDSESKKLVVMDDWAQRYPTATEDVARVCVDLSTKYLDTSREERKTWPHILQFSAEERMTKYEMCEVLAEILGLPLEGGMVPNKHGNDPHAKVQRPYDTHLSTEELKGIGIDVSCVSFRDWW